MTGYSRYDVHAGSVCSPGPDCECFEIEPDTKSGVRILGNLLSDSVLHMPPVNEQMEATFDALASCQEYELSLSTRQWVMLVGILTSMDSQVPLGKLHWRLIQLSFCDHWDQRK